MIIGNNFSELMKCDYLDSNLQPASDMLLKCIGDKSKGEEGLCTSSYTHLYDNISSNSENIAIKRGMNAGYGILPYSISESKSESVPKPVTQKKDSQISSNVEGFTGSFITDNGMGESYVKPGSCPQGYRWCSKSKKCIQVCTNCKYKDGMKSREFNEADKCFPEGVYDGISSDGTLKCTCGKDNRYCSDKFVANIFTTDGLLYFDDTIKNVGNNLSTLFDLKGL
jgi:hypothetical protein